MRLINTTGQVDNCRQLGHTSAMKIAVRLARHRRLAALGGFSLLLHLLAFVWIDAVVTAPPPVSGMPLALRLAHAPAAPAKPVPTLEPKAPPPAPVQPRPTPAPDPAPAPATVFTPIRSAPAAPTAATTPVTAPGTAPLQMPGRYRVRLPPSSTLQYAVTRAAPGQSAVAGAPAQLVWESDGDRYRLRVEGVLGVLASEGGGDDAGIAPNQASESGAAGGVQLTRFDREARRIDYGPLGTGDPLRLGSQDRASVLIQLAGIGLAEPDQVQDAIDILVAGAGGARITRWQVLGKEDLNTAAGQLATVRLAQLAQAGEARVEVWLAPARDWLPVQLRVTYPDGTVANQVVTAIQSAPVPGQ